MPIAEHEVVSGGYYITEGQQLRKVIELRQDEQGRTRIVYMVKSDLIPQKTFGYTATLANPALLSTFANACTKRLDAAAIRQRRLDLILLEGE
ncbi:MAG: hypothetical protein AB7U63_10405 [Porticoccaceae bacterium]